MTETEQKNLCSALRILEQESARQVKLFEAARPNGNYYAPLRRRQTLDNAALTIREVLGEKLANDAAQAGEGHL